MNLEQERRALQLMEQAMACDIAGQEGWLSRNVADDPEMLEYLRELLQASRSIDDVLPTALPTGELEVSLPPERVGPYRLGELLGEGGMGRVFRAARIDGGFEQDVAVKLLRGGRVSNAVAAQFTRERQILARLQHRNIAQLLDGGTTATGQPWFAMELVAGDVVTDYAAGRPLRQRLLLFQQICAAVQYAHGQLVVHADLKPSNLVVTRDGTVKLLDFGVARVLAASGSEAPTLGVTAAYASPARRRGESATVADDIYSLGRVLHDLAGRGAPADLLAIADVATAEEASARQESVALLRDDVQRWLDGFAVSAFGNHPAYLLSKFVARHRGGVAAATVAAVALLASSIGMSVMYLRAERPRVDAEQRFTDLRRVSHYLLFDVYDRLETMPRALLLRAELAALAQRYLDTLAQDPRAPIQVREELVEGLWRLARVQASPGNASLAQVDRARANLMQAEALLHASPLTPASGLLSARVALARAQMANWQDLDFGEAHSALDRVETIIGPASKGEAAELRELRLAAALQRATALQWQGRYADSIRIADGALAASAALDADVPSRLRLLRAQLVDIRAESTYFSGDIAGAEVYYREHLALVEALAAAEPENLALARRRLQALWGLGTTLLALDHPKEAEELLARSESIGRALLLLEPDDVELQRMHDIASNAHAQALLARGSASLALPVLERSASYRRAQWQSSRSQWSRARDYAIVLMTLGDARDAAGQAGRACESWREALGVFHEVRTAGRLAQLDQEHAVSTLEKRVAKDCAENR